jgi:hypothetical protein
MASVKRTRAKQPRKASAEELGAEVQKWESGAYADESWRDAPEAVVRQSESVSVSIRFPKQMLEVLRVFAEREKIGYQVIIKRWLDERIAQEYERLSAKATARRAPMPELLRDSADVNGPHYQLN